MPFAEDPDRRTTALRRSCCVRQFDRFRSVLPSRRPVVGLHLKFEHLYPIRTFDGFEFERQEFRSATDVANFVEVVAELLLGALVGDDRHGGCS